ncbi:MAG: sialate O-acetylesterase [Kiritimatiellia bacterium]
MKGVLWWQGESDVSAGARYQNRLESLIKGWRRDWQCGEFPFICVQLASLNEKAEGKGAQWVRESQRRVCSALPATALVVIFDITNGDLHPAVDLKKGPIAERPFLKNGRGDGI